MTEKVAVVSINKFFFVKKNYVLFFQVTGSNKGIGYAIVDKLCSVFDGTIYLTGNINFSII